MKNKLLTNALTTTFLLVLMPFILMAEDAAEAGFEPNPFLESLEFRSVINLGDGLQFSLHDPVENRTFWIRVGETRHDIEVVGYDPIANTLELGNEGDIREVGLSRSRIVNIEEVSEQQNGNGRVEWRAQRNERREAWREARRERVRDLQETWRGVAQESPRLQQIEEQYRETFEDMRQLRGAFQGTERGTEEHRLLREIGREVRQDLQRLNELTSAEVESNPAFEGVRSGDLRRMLDSRTFRREVRAVDGS